MYFYLFLLHNIILKNNIKRFLLILKIGLKQIIKIVDIEN